jgi:excisionase family DNA binding protein
MWSIGSGGKAMDTQDVDTEGLMTAKEVATFLRVPISWVYSRTRMAAENGFPVMKVGKYCRFTKGDVLIWLHRNAPGHRD